MASDEETHRPEPSSEDTQADPPPEGSDGKKPLRRRIADGWNGLGGAGKLAVIGGVVVAVVGGIVAVALSNPRAADLDPDCDDSDDSTDQEPVTRMYTNHAGGYYRCSHKGCSKKINHIYMTDHDCCGRCWIGRDCMTVAASECDGPGGFPHTYRDALLFPGVCTICDERPEGHRSDDPHRWPNR
ncbi:hypothetical protein [Streptomyces sp. TRM68416]|uniref:hypothetical protein n=1 Tax=Streptomyces sp. TRM68416 TaxID=2758412 RepID=UPI001662149B|nr:hypothetical protein [Streptomyces sp. TRM68416]MBD0844775.1 hypothetical protein [Streptomyces sp. TRM68416]